MSSWLPYSRLAQLAHIGWGIALCLALVRWTDVPPSFAAASVTLFAALKESIFDPITEDTETQGIGLVDFAFWVVGAWSAYGISKLHFHLPQAPDYFILAALGLSALLMLGNRIYELKWRK